MNFRESGRGSSRNTPTILTFLIQQFADSTNSRKSGTRIRLPRRGCYLRLVEARGLRFPSFRAILQKSPAGSILARLTS